MTESDKLDICEALYGKMTRAFGVFYWDAEKKHLVNIDTGEDLLSHVEYSPYSNPRYVNGEYVKVGKQALFIKEQSEYIMCYNSKCERVINMELNIPARYIKEYISNKNGLAIYLLGRKTIASGMKVLILDLNTGKKLDYLDNVVRIFESEQVLKIVTIENGELSNITFSL